MCSALRAERQNPAAKTVLKAVLAQASEPTLSFEGLTGVGSGLDPWVAGPRGLCGAGLSSLRGRKMLGSAGGRTVKEHA